MEETLGKRISARRKALGLTQDALAEQLGITAQAVSKWENGQSCPDITMLPRLAEIFRCTTDELLGLAPKEIPVIETAAPEEPKQEPEPVKSAIHWNALASPGAAFGFWLFLTGLVTLLDSLLPYPMALADPSYRCSLMDIALSCGIFAFGLSALLRRFSFLRLACAGFGAICVLNLMTQPGITDMDWRIPLCAGLAIFGLDIFLDILLGRRRTISKGQSSLSCMQNYFDTEADSFRCATSFGENTRRVTMPRLSSGRAEVNFGNLTLDLSGCQQFTEISQLNLDCSFGEMTILVPRFCRAVVNVQTAFANCSTYGSPDSDASAMIYVNGNAAFGHITFRYI
ncbi:MAG: helix-turn-helix transcriptional regulator [Oscillospiraceae bacterium]